MSGSAYESASNYLVVPAGGHTFTVSSPTNNATLTTSATLGANTVTSIFVVGMFAGTPQSELVNAQTAGLPSMPNTGSDPHAVPPQVDGAQPLTPWSWPLAIVSLLLIGSGLFLRRGVVKK